MEVFRDILIVIVSIIVISKGAIMLVDSAVRIAKKLQVSELIIGLTIVALGTSAPEFAVTVISSFSGNSDILLVGLIAISRKVILLDYETMESLGIIGIAILIGTITGGYYLIKKSHKANQMIAYP